MRKKLVLIVLLSFFIAPLAGAYFNPGKPSGFVNDFAGVLNGEQKQLLENKLSQFEKETSNEVSVAIIPSLRGDTIENFTVKLFEEWGIGKENKDNGVLVLIALEDKKVRIEVGYGLEGALTDAQSFWIINNVIRPAFQSGNYYEGLDQTVDKIISATKGEYVPSDTSSNNGQKSDSWGSVISFLLFFAFIVIVHISSILGRSKSWWAGGVVGGVIGVVIGLIAGFIFAGLAAIFVLVPLGLLFDFLVSRAYQKGKASGNIPWWFGGGGWGGGSDSSGGFGGFGGGRSGGGGSSGGW